jgi:hypothetical protein
MAWKIKHTKTLTSIGVGVLDVGLEALDDMQGWTTPLMNSHDIERLALTLISGVGNYMDFMPDEMETVFLSEWPLVIKTIRDGVKHYVLKPMSPEEAGFREVTRPATERGSPGVPPTTAPEAPESSIIT